MEEANDVATLEHRGRLGQILLVQQNLPAVLACNHIDFKAVGVVGQAEVTGVERLPWTHCFKNDLVADDDVVVCVAMLVVRLDVEPGALQHQCEYDTKCGYEIRASLPMASRQTRIALRSMSPARRLLTVRNLLLLTWRSCFV